MKAPSVPGLVLAALYAGYVLLITMFKPAAAPALPKEFRTLQRLQPAAAGRRLADPAADPDLPGARHHLHRRRDADRGRRHGCASAHWPWPR